MRPDSRLALALYKLITYLLTYLLTYICLRSRSWDRGRGSANNVFHEMGATGNLWLTPHVNAIADSIVDSQLQSAIIMINDVTIFTAKTNK